MAILKTIPLGLLGIALAACAPKKPIAEKINGFYVLKSGNKIEDPSGRFEARYDISPGAKTANFSIIPVSRDEPTPGFYPPLLFPKDFPIWIAWEENGYAVWVGSAEKPLRCYVLNDGRWKRAEPEPDKNRLEKVEHAINAISPNTAP